VREIDTLPTPLPRHTPIGSAVWCIFMGVKVKGSLTRGAITRLDADDARGSTADMTPLIAIVR
jgi:hypothetical protein